jgi:hypothetical protein
MNRVVVRLVVQPESSKIAVLVAGIVANNVKCIRQSVLLVEKKQLYLSNPQVTDRYIAVIATNRTRAATGKILRDLLRINPEKIFFLHNFVLLGGSRYRFLGNIFLDVK